MSATHPTESSPHATATVSPDSDGPKSLASGQAATGTWLVAYGIGAPVLFLTQSGVADALRKTGAARSIALTFLVGVSVQVLSALLYKTTMWQLYMGVAIARGAEHAVSQGVRMDFESFLARVCLRCGRDRPVWLGHLANCPYSDVNAPAAGNGADSLFHNGSCRNFDSS